MMAEPASNSHLRLKPDAQPEQALATLRDLMTSLRNLPGELSVRPDNFDYVFTRRDRYLQWVENAEQLLSNHTDLNTAHVIFATPRYGHIRDSTSMLRDQFH
jgi:hypothetical protein